MTQKLTALSECVVIPRKFRRVSFFIGRTIAEQPGRHLEVRLALDVPQYTPLIDRARRGLWENIMLPWDAGCHEGCARRQLIEFRFVYGV